MTAMSVARKLTRADDSPRQFPVKAGSKILEGAMVGLNRGLGTIDNLAADVTLVPYGVARHTVDNSGSLSPAPECFVDPGVVPMIASGLTIADEGKMAYCVDNQTFALSSSGGTRPLIGEVMEVVSATLAYIRVAPPSAASRDVLEPGANLGDSSPTITVLQGRWRILPAATLTTNRTVTLGTTSAAKGDVIRITRQDATANTLAVVNGGAGAGTMLTMPASKVNFGDFYFDGTNWELAACGVQ